MTSPTFICKSLMVLSMLSLFGCSGELGAPAEPTPETMNSESEEEIEARCDEDADINCLERAEGALVLSPDMDDVNGVEAFDLVAEDQLEIAATPALLRRFKVGAPIMRGIPGKGLVMGRVVAVEDVADAGADGVERKRVRFEKTDISGVIPKGRLRLRRRVECTPTPDVSGGMNLDCRIRRIAPAPPLGSPEAEQASEETRQQELRGRSLGIEDCTSALDISNDYMGLALEQCRLTITFDAHFNMRWGFARPDSLTTYLEMETDAAIELLAYARATNTIGEEFELTNGAINFAFNVGGVPMYVSGGLYFGYNVHYQGEASFRAGLEFNSTRKLGFTYVRGDGFTKINDKNPSFTKIGPEYTAHGLVEADAYIRPEIEVGVGINNILSGGLTVGLAAGLDFTAEVMTDQNEAEACASLQFFANPTLGYNLEVFGVLDREGHWPLKGFERCLLGECPTCISTEEQVDPTCEEDSMCDSDADCSVNSRNFRRRLDKSDIDVAGAPDDFSWSDDAICVSGTCDSSEGDCACGYAWINRCCTTNDHCGEREYCNVSTNRCTFNTTDEFDVIKTENGFSSSCETDLDCDDNRLITTDTCSDRGECVHTSNDPEQYQPMCNSDSDCGFAGPGFRADCTGGRCVRVRYIPCQEKSCNDNNRLTHDSCVAGQCVHEVSSSVEVGVSPEFLP